MTPSIDRFLDLAPVIPVLVIESLEHAVPLARALLSGGLSVLEITLRTAVACAAISRIRDALPQAHVGAGTVVCAADVARAATAGAAFLVSPGNTPSLLRAAEDQGIPLLPGVATASEAMQLLEQGHTRMKLFPAESCGGVGLLRALAGPLPQLRFCPTGGITSLNATTYLELDNVACVGGSWPAPTDAVRRGDWSRVEDLARAAAHLRPTSS